MTWRNVKLGDVCDVIAGGTPKRSELAYWGGAVPWVKISDMLQGRITQTEESITQAGLTGSTAKLLPPGTLLVSIFATIGRTAVLQCEAATNQAIVGVIPKKKDMFDGWFLEYSLQQKTAWLKHISRGVAQPNINGSVLKATELPLPPLDEQKRIAAILDAADALRAKRRESLAQLDALIQSTFLEMFGDPVTNPKGWEVVDIGDEINYLTSGSRGWAKYYANNGDIFIRIQNLKNGRLDLNHIAFVNAPESAEAKRTRVESGDVLVSITADLGRTAVIPAGITNAYINQHLAILRFSNLNPFFVSYQLASKGGQSQFARLNREGVKAGLNFNDVKSIKLTKPPLDLQHHFAAIVESIEKQKVLQRAHLAELDTLFAALQQRAFNGELST